MARNVYVMRHAEQQLTDGAGLWQPNAKLAPGAEKRIQVAAEYFRKRGIVFDQFWHSRLKRAEQTCLFLAQKAADTECRITKALSHSNLGPGRIETWETLYCSWRRFQPNSENPRLRPADWLELFPDLCTREAVRMLGAISEIAQGLEDGEDALAVSHIPLINLAEWRATGIRDSFYHPVRPALDYCQTICFTFDERDAFVGCEAHLF